MGQSSNFKSVSSSVPYHFGHIIFIGISPLISIHRIKLSTGKIIREVEDIRYHQTSSDIYGFSCCSNFQNFGNIVIVSANLIRHDKDDALGLTHPSPNGQPMTNEHVD